MSTKEQQHLEVESEEEDEQYLINRPSDLAEIDLEEFKKLEEAA
jgi:hypothetical protein